MFSHAATQERGPRDDDQRGPLRGSQQPRALGVRAPLKFSKPAEPVPHQREHAEHRHRAGDHAAPETAGSSRMTPAAASNPVSSN